MKFLFREIRILIINIKLSYSNFTNSVTNDVLTYGIHILKVIYTDFYDYKPKSLLIEYVFFVIYGGNVIPLRNWCDSVTTFKLELRKMFLSSTSYLSIILSEILLALT